MLLICLFALYCTTGKKIEWYVLPNISDANRKALIERFEKGKILYTNNCAACHGIYGKGKDSVTNVTKQQIDNYTILALANPKKLAVLKKISPEPFNYIITFLRLRKPGKNL